MTIKDVSDARAEAQKRISDIIIQLENDTDCKVTKIEVQHSTEEGFGVRPIILVRYFKIILEVE